MTLYNNIEQQILALQTRQNRLEAEMSQRVAATVTAQVGQPRAMVNLIQNGDFNFSVDNWDNAVAVGGDSAKETKYWYRFPSTTTLFSEVAANRLKASGHLLYAASEGADADIPDWDQSNGYARIGHLTNRYVLAHPLYANIARPGDQLVVIFILKNSTGSLPANLGWFAGLWDNTAGQEKFLEGSDLVLTGAPVGTIGATSRDYLVVITTDWGQQYKSNVLTIANTNATISASNYVSLSWTQVPGTVLASVYRKTGATYVRVADISNGATSAFDNGSMAAPESGFPSITLTKAKAYTEIKPQTFLTAFEGQTWPAFSISIVVPSTYNMGLTTGKQWLVTGPTVALGSQRQLYIDRIGLGFQAGGWAESTVEKPAGNVSTTMTSSDQGTGGSQNTYNPPPGYGGYDGGIYHPSTL